MKLRFLLLQFRTDKMHSCVNICCYYDKKLFAKVLTGQYYRVLEVKWKQVSGINY